MNIELYTSFINEQKAFFDEYISPTFKNSWHDPTWQGGTRGSGWLLSRSANTSFSFSSINRVKGIRNLNIDNEFQYFMKAVLILSYRKANMKSSPQKLYAELLVLKRWYSSLLDQDKENVHPCMLDTNILNCSFKILEENSSKANLPDHAGTYLRLQEMLNHYGFTTKPLEFSQKSLYINRQNRTPNAKKTKDLIDQFELNEEDLDKEKLITIRTFINIVSLINLCQATGEKLMLNLMLLLIITGLRSTEAFLLKTDALIKRPILDPFTKEHITLDGVKQYSLGIQYHGAKGSGYRIHWVEPSTANLVELIFKNVLDLTKEYREHLRYIRSKQCINILPRSLDEIQSDYVEIDDLIGTIFSVKESKKGHGYQRDKIYTTLSNIVEPKRTVKESGIIKRYYLKSDIEKYLSYKAENYKINHKFNYMGGVEDIPYEEILFLHQFNSTNLFGSFIIQPIIILFNINLFNAFFGNSSKVSVFKKYMLYEDTKELSKISSHIPRHNINTFLALSGLSEHLQAILMGRVDINQNQYYQHLALKQYRKAASLFEKNELVFYKEKDIPSVPIPLQSIKNDGLMFFSKNLDLEHNLKKNLQTFDNKGEVSNYIKNSFFDEYFQDIAQSFNELIKDDVTQANQLVQRHAYLHPLPFGACMREIAVHDCPKRLACQSGDQCGNFALTDRQGELDAIQQTLGRFLDQFQKIEKLVIDDDTYKEMLIDLRKKIDYFTKLKDKALYRKSKLIPVPVFDYGNHLNKLPTTLSELFAIEQKKLESKEH